MKVVPVEEIDVQLFDSIQKKSNEVYSSKMWAAAYDSGLKRFAMIADNGDIVGGWCAYQRRKWGLEILITPPFASHCGLFFFSEKKSVAGIQSETKKCMEAIAHFLIQSNYHFFKIEFPPEFHDFQSFIWKKINVTTRYTYLLSLNSSVEQLESSFDPKLRNKISKGKQGTLELSHKSNIELAHQLFTDNLRRKGLSWNDHILRSLLGLPSMHYTIISDGDAAVAAALVCGQNEKCYYLFGSTDKSQQQNAAGPLALRSAIVQAKEMGFTTFDFEGSMIPEVEGFFRQFGGKLTPLYSINGGRSLWPRLISLYLK